MIPARVAVALFALCTALAAQSPYSAWKNGLPADPAWFPIGVWLQDPSKAPAYKKLGINLFVGLWQGPTKQQLAVLDKHGMQVITSQNAVGLQSPLRKHIVGWQQVDEPDNAQPRKTIGYGPPIPPKTIINRYKVMKNADKTRPVFLNLGQGVANDWWHGRGSRNGKLEDYPEYIKGTDIVAYDIYPVTHPDKRITGKLEFVAKGVDRLVKWSKGKKVVWNFIEAARIHSTRVPSPEQIKAEVWMSLIHGSMGIVYFCHEWKPKFNAAAPLSNPKTAAGLAAINRQIIELAPVLNSPTLPKAATVKSRNRKVPVAFMVKRHEGATYVFAVAMRGEKTRATFRVAGQGRARGAEVTVLGENRKITMKGARFVDDFGPYGVRLYRIGAGPGIGTGK